VTVYEARSLFRLARYLRSCRFPADRSELLVAAVQNHAPIPLLRQLSALPGDCRWSHLLDLEADLTGPVRTLTLD
jgi:Protein of unknown function (DUF2795)